MSAVATPDARTDAPLARPDYRLQDNLWAAGGSVFLTGTQALVRLLLMQRARDAAGGLEHARLRQRLPRLAARHGRPGDLEGGHEVQGRRHPLRAGDQRGTRRHAGAGHAARRVRPRAHGGWRVLDVVRQGAGRRPRRRCAQARQRLRQLAARRRAGGGRRRPRLRVVVDAAPERPALPGLAHADRRAGQRGRVPRVRLVRLGVVALLGQLGRLHGAVGGGGERRHGGPRCHSTARHTHGTAPTRCARPPATRRRPMACTTAGPTCRACASNRACTTSWPRCARSRASTRSTAT